MKREIKFRGKRVDNGEWIYGHYYEYNCKSIICNENHTDDADTYNNFEVIHETVSQFTGLKDKNGVDIYEGDIVECGYGKGEVTTMLGCYMVRWIDDKEANMEFLGLNRKTSRIREDGEEFTLIGNIHDKQI